MASGSGIKRAIRGVLGTSRTVRMGLAVVLVVALVGFGAFQLVPLWERKTTIEAAESTTGTITSAEYARNQYDISYEYTVDGRTYESTRVFPGPYAPRGTASGDVLEQLPVYDEGETTTVYYVPGDPDHAWLLTRDDLVSRHVVFFVAAGFVALLLLAYLYVEVKLPGLGGGREPRRPASDVTGAGGTDPDGPAGEDPAQQAGEMLSALGEIDPDDPPSEAEMRERLTEAMPDDAVQGARTPDGDLDVSQLSEGSTGQRPGAGGSPTGLLGTLGRVLGLLKVAGLIVLVGGALLVGSGVALTHLLAP